jgi:hypothetical protein
VRKWHNVDFASLDGFSSGFAFAKADIPCLAEPASGGCRRTSGYACEACSDACQRSAQAVVAALGDMARTASMDDVVSAKLGGGGVVARHFARGRPHPKLDRSREAGAPSQRMVIFSLGKIRRSLSVTFRKAIETD